MSKIIGIICAWACENYIGLAIEQALAICDEVIVNVSAHSEVLEKYKDRTYNIAKYYELGLRSSTNRKIKFIDVNYDKSNHALIKAALLNYMLTKSDIFEPGNWIWILDADEFYDNDTIRYVKDLVNVSRYTDITFRDYYFFINTTRYLVGEHQRLFKIQEHESNMFYPTQKWLNSYNNPITLGTIENPSMYHYGMLTNPWAKLDFWKSEYPNNPQWKKVNWLNIIYRGYDFSNEEYWIDLNKFISGENSCWFNDGYVGGKDGKPFIFTGKHPDLIPKFILEVSDWRKEYNFV